MRGHDEASALCEGVVMGRTVHGEGLACCYFGVWEVSTYCVVGCRFRRIAASDEERERESSFDGKISLCVARHRKEEQVTGVSRGFVFSLARRVCRFWTVLGNFPSLIVQGSWFFLALDSNEGFKATE